VSGISRQAGLGLGVATGHVVYGESADRGVPVERVAARTVLQPGLMKRRLICSAGQTAIQSGPAR
jgi:hypothetical protein